MGIAKVAMIREYDIRCNKRLYRGHASCAEKERRKEIKYRDISNAQGREKQR